MRRPSLLLRAAAAARTAAAGAPHSTPPITAPRALHTRPTALPASRPVALRALAAAPPTASSSLVNLSNHVASFVGVHPRRFYAADAAAAPTDGPLLTIPLAQTGEGIKECELTAWFVEEGVVVAEFDKLCEVQSDKATVEVTSRFAGVVARRCAAVGDIVQVGAALLELRLADGVRLEEDGGSAGLPPPPPPTPTAPHATHPPDQDAPLTHASPAVRRVAKELGVDIDDVRGTGPGGRVVKADVERVAASVGGQAVSAPAAAAQSTASSPPPSIDPTLHTTLLPIRGYRRAMVKTMDAASRVPHFHLHSTARAARLASVRAVLAADPALTGAKLTVTAFLVKALAQTAAAFPTLNSELTPDASSLALHATINVGVAVDSPHGLAVPVVRDVASRSLASIAVELERLRAASLDGALTETDVAPCTITLSNIGALGGGHATPLVAPPQVCILAVGRAVDAAVSDGAGGWRAEPTLPLSWGADHRVVDGATLARASAHFEKLLEEPTRLLLRAA